MKIYSFLLLLSSFLISCNKSLIDTESLGLLALLGYRQTVNVGGTFFGNFNADVKAVPLSADGKCDTTQAGLGRGSTDSSGGFQVNYPRISTSGGYVCVIAYPKADGTSRFFAVDQQRELAWTGNAFSVLVLPEPSTTSRSRFNVVSTMFNRMATQKLEKLAEGNTDITRAGTLLKSANKQIVSQFGLSRGLSKSISTSTITLKEAFNRVLYSETRASSLESATPDLNDIVIDFNKKDDPVTLKFTVIIGGIQSLADPNDPSSYDKVVGIISNVIASGNSSANVVFPGGATLSAGGSFGALVSSKIQTFVQSQGAALGFSESEINNIKAEAVALASAIDNPPVSASGAVDKPLYSLATTFTYKAGETFSINPQVTGVSGFKIIEICSTICQPVIDGVTSDYLQLSPTSGVISGTVPANIPGDIAIQLRISGTRNGTPITGRVNLTFRGKPNLSYTGTYLVNSSTATSPQITIGPLPADYNFSFTPTLIGANISLSSSTLPPGKCISFNTTTGNLNGNFSCITAETSIQIIATNDIDQTIYSVKFIPNSKPSVSNLGISGILLYQNTISAYYTYTDANDNIENGSTYSWFLCQSALGTCNAISGANSKTYTIQAGDVGSYLQYQVTPIDTLGLAGDPVLSSAMLVENRAPSIESVSINSNGNISIGDTLTATISGYSDPDSTPLKSYFYNWFSCTTATTCSMTAAGTAPTYTIQDTDNGKFIKLQVNPVDNLDAMGTAVYATVYVKDKTTPSISDTHIYITSQSPTSVSLKWNSASDNLPIDSQLSYKVFYSNVKSDVDLITPNSSTYPNVQNYVGNPANPIQITGLTPETVYYFRVMVEDSDENRSFYNTRSVLVSNNLMAYLPFDGNFTNKSSVSLTANSIGVISYSPGFFGSAISFTGNNQSIALLDNVAIKPTSQITISAWVNRDWTTCSGQNTNGETIVSSTQSSGYYLGCKGDFAEFHLFVGGSYKIVKFIQNNLKGWNKLTGTYDGTNLRIYLNGIVMNQITTSGSITYVANSVQIGSEATGSTSIDPGYTLNGLIDEVTIYNRALSEQEIKADVPN